MSRKVSVANAVASAADKAARNRDNEGVMLPGKTVSFASSIGLAERVGVLSGFGASEDDGRWSAGDYCSLDIKLRGVEPALAYELVIDVLPFEMGSHRASVTVSADETRAAHAIPLGMGWVQLRLPCRVDFSARPPRTRIQFWIDNPTSPSQLGVGNDARLLGFKLRSVQLEVAGRAPVRPGADDAGLTEATGGSGLSPASSNQSLLVRARRWLVDRSLVMAPLRWMRRTSLTLSRIEAQYSQLVEHRLGEVRADVAGIRAHVDRLEGALQKVGVETEAIQKDVFVGVREQREALSSLGHLVERAANTGVLSILDELAAIEERNRSELQDALRHQIEASETALLQQFARKVQDQNHELVQSIRAALESHQQGIAAAIEHGQAGSLDAIAAMEERVLAATGAVDSIVGKWGERGLSGALDDHKEVVTGVQQALDRVLAEQQSSLSRLSSLLEQRLERSEQASAAALQTTVSAGIAHQIAEEVPLLISLHQKVDSLVHHHRPPLFLRGASGWIIRSQFGYFSCAFEDEMLVMYLAEYGELEPGLRKLIVSLLRAGDVFVDVGANVGVHSVTAARAVGPTGKVFAIEGAPPTVEHLRRSIRLSGVDGNVVVLPFAAGADIGSKRTIHLSTTSGHSSLFPLPDEVSATEVSATTLDELIPGSADLVKIDVEGAELEVIMGMRRLLENPEIAVTVEFAPSHLARAGTTQGDWRDMIQRHGFKIYRVDDVDGTCAEVGDIGELMDVFSANLLLVRPGTRIANAVVSHVR